MHKGLELGNSEMKLCRSKRPQPPAHIPRSKPQYTIHKDQISILGYIMCSGARWFSKKKVTYFNLISILGNKTKRNMAKVKFMDKAKEIDA